MLVLIVLLFLVGLPGTGAPPALPPATPANGGDTAMSEPLSGRWKVIDVPDAPMPEGAVPLLEFSAGRIGGRTGCNTFSASMTQTGDALSFGPARTTRMACGTETMQLEATFLRALMMTDRFEIGPDGGLTLLGQNLVQMRAVRE